MTELILIRHGQANSSGENYDELTATGLTQAVKIGTWLAAAGYSFDRVIHGGLKRQQQTLDAIRGEFEKSGKVLPPQEIHPAFAEFDLRVWTQVAGSLRHGHADFAAMLRDWNHARHENAANKGEIFKKLTAVILAEWVKQGETFTGAESFPAFQKRVFSALETPRGKNARSLAVTSGGPIALLTGKVLSLGLDATLKLMRRIHNTSLHHLLLDDGGWDLKTFNSTPHLKADELTLV